MWRERRHRWADHAVHPGHYHPVQLLTIHIGEHAIFDSGRQGQQARLLPRWPLDPLPVPHVKRGTMPFTYQAILLTAEWAAKVQAHVHDRLRRSIDLEHQHIPTKEINLSCSLTWNVVHANQRYLHVSPHFMT